jgi:hypothetical protein
MILGVFSEILSELSTRNVVVPGCGGCNSRMGPRMVLQLDVTLMMSVFLMNL